VLRFEAQLESLQDPAVAFRIVKEEHPGALVPTQLALPRDSYGLVDLHFCHAFQIISHIQLGDPGGRNAVEVPFHSGVDGHPVGLLDFRATQRCVEDAILRFQFVHVEAFDQLLRGGVFRRGDAVGREHGVETGGDNIPRLRVAAGEENLDLTRPMHVFDTRKFGVNAVRQHFGFGG